MPDMGVSAGCDRRGADRRRGLAGRRAVVVPSDDAAEAGAVREVERRVVGVRRAVERRVADVRRAVERRVDEAARRVVDAARRRVDEARRAEPLATSRAFFVSPSMRFKTLFTSARVLAFLTCD